MGPNMSFEDFLIEILEKMDEENTNNIQVEMDLAGEAKVTIEVILTGIEYNEENN